MMVARASVKAADLTTAQRVGGEVCASFGRWGAWEVRRLEPYDKVPGEFVLYVAVAVDRRGNPVTLVREIARAMASGDWEFHEDDPDETWAVWDVKGGGTPAVRGVTWLCLELLPDHRAGRGSPSTRDDRPVQPPQ